MEPTTPPEDTTPESLDDLCLDEDTRLIVEGVLKMLQKKSLEIDGEIKLDLPHPATGAKINIRTNTPGVGIYFYVMACAQYHHIILTGSAGIGSANHLHLTHFTPEAVLSRLEEFDLKEEVEKAIIYQQRSQATQFHHA